MQCEQRFLFDVVAVVAEGCKDLGQEDRDEFRACAPGNCLEGGADDEKIVTSEVGLNGGGDHYGELARRVD